MKFWKKYKIPTTPEQRQLRKKHLLLGLASGLLLGLSFPPIPFPFLVFVSFVPYFFLLQKREGLGEINRFTYFTLFFFCLITLYWVGSWTKEADPFLKISGILLVILSPAFYLIVTSLYYFSTKIVSKKIALFLFPVYWVTFEYIYSITDLRFPWLMLSNSIPNLNLFIQIADVVGAYGLSLIILYINLLIFFSIKQYGLNRKINWRYLIPLLMLVFIPLVYGLVKISSYKESNKKVKVGLIQPNFNPWEKWQGGSVSDQLNVYLDLSEKAISKGAKLIVWPESALPCYLLTGSYMVEANRVQQFVFEKNIYLMTGMPDAQIFFYDTGVIPPSDAKKSKTGDYAYVSYNSILFYMPDGINIQKYHKIMLVPFGEKVPFVEEIPFLGSLIKWQVGISSWNVGEEKTIFVTPTFKPAGIICIESIYPDFVADFVAKGADFISVVTNDSWYGYSSGPFQHKEISVIRAVENRRSVIRAANGGISCIIDPLGNTIAETKLFTKDILVGDVTLNSEITFFTKYPRVIPYFVSLISLLTILAFAAIKVKEKMRKK